MLTAKNLRAVLVTIHQPLAKAIASLSIDMVMNTARVTEAALSARLRHRPPASGSRGAKPHMRAKAARSGGKRSISSIPPRDACERMGVLCGDAKPADTLFHEDARSAYDAVICLYHDQALIPVKTLDFWGGVNITLGLPIVRTSPDHGVGFDIAGRGLARPESLIAAVRLAGEVATQRDSVRASQRVA